MLCKRCICYVAINTFRRLNHLLEAEKNTHIFVIIIIIIVFVWLNLIILRTVVSQHSLCCHHNGKYY